MRDIESLQFTPQDARGRHGLDSMTLPFVPTVLSVPCSYSILKKACRMRIALVDRWSAYRAELMLRGADQKFEEYEITKRADFRAKYPQRRQLEHREEVVLPRPATVVVTTYLNLIEKATTFLTL
jgi:hypothetical protein